MKILILGAGVIGTTYAWQLSNASHDVTLLVRKTKREKYTSEGFLKQAHLMLSLAIRE